jgi:hypothetical protein
MKGHGGAGKSTLAGYVYTDVPSLTKEPQRAALVAAPVKVS